jgi:superfamily II DNA or RNA helicase
MSLVADVNNILVEKVNKELVIKLEPKFGLGQTKYIHPYTLIGEKKICLPFAYAARVLKVRRPLRNTFPATRVKFQGSLRPEQKTVRKEAVQCLNKRGSVIVSAYCGFGKCLGINTPIIMYDGTVKAVQDIKEGELLMGDDSTPRKVLSTCVGEEQMYNIVPTKGDSFRCNESHILSLKISSHKVIHSMSNQTFYAKYFDHSDRKYRTKHFSSAEEAETFLLSVKDPDILDISVKDFLSLSKTVRDQLKLYHVPVEFEEKDVAIDPYMIGLWLGDGTSLQPCITTNDEEIVRYIQDFCCRHRLSTQDSSGTRCPTYRVCDDKTINSFSEQLRVYNLLGNKHIPNIYKCNNRSNRLKLLAGLVDSDGYMVGNCYEITQKNRKLAYDILYLVRSLGLMGGISKCYKNCMYNGEERGAYYYRVSFHGTGVEDIPVLLERKRSSPHKQIKNSMESGFSAVPIEDRDYYGFTIDGNHRFLLGDFTVTHNTICAIHMAAGIGFRTLIIVNKIVLMRQWEESILKFCPDSIVHRITTKSPKKPGDFYIMNAQNVEKKGIEFFSDVGLVIIDEAHMIMAETLSKSLQYIYPRYLVGLTATPYRPDGLNILLQLYFGRHKIIRKLHRKHIVYKVDTGFIPKVERTFQGRVNWGSILDQQANCVHRNELILRIIESHVDRNFLVLVKRVSQGRYLIKRLEEKGISVTNLIGSNQEFESSARVLIGTCQKVGTGFDHPKLDTLILAADIQEYFIQYLGRIFRVKDSKPLVFDLVDSNGILRKHYATRERVYREHGGMVYPWKMK